MQQKDPGWERMWFKGNKVWAAAKPDGAPLVVDGRVLIKYRLDQEHEYRVLPQHLAPLDKGAATPAGKARGARRAKPEKRAGFPAAPAAVEVPDGAVRIYTDGASSGNPGPAGIGVLLCHGDKRREISRYIGEATNNIAELEAIRTGLSQVKRKDLPVRLFTDSGYAFGLLVLGWQAKKNQSLVAEIRRLMSAFKDLQLIKVAGHAGDEGNERADFLATSAASQAGGR
jgi:ribonuclease HI